jgi:XTP/dITP diphosphohydrolase
MFSMKIVIATGNPHKVREISEIFDAGGVEFVSARDAGVAAFPEETGASFAENAKQKALFAMSETGLPALADDSGLCVDYLNGEPGIYSARYAGESDNEKNIDKLLGKLDGVPMENRGAKFVCAVCLALPNPSVANSKLIETAGEVCGRILFERHGESGFGYDPIFEAFETPGRSFAELSAEEKNAISHRRRALTKLSLLGAGTRGEVV